MWPHSSLAILGGEGDGWGADDLLNDADAQLHDGIAALTGLTALRIEAAVPSDALEPLAKLLSLRELTLTIDDEGLEPAALPLASPQLTRVQIGGNFQVSRGTLVSHLPPLGKREGGRGVLSEGGWHLSSITCVNGTSPAEGGGT